MKTYHLLLSCHMLDREKMEVLLRGMEAHSSFFAFYMNEAFNGAAGETFNDLMPRPIVDLWNGFITREFPHDILCGLLESIRWTFPDLVFVSMTTEKMGNGLVTRTPGEYRTAVDLDKVWQD